MITKKEFEQLNKYQKGLSMLSNHDYVMFKGHIRYFLKSRANKLKGVDLKIAFKNLYDDIVHNYEDFIRDM